MKKVALITGITGQDGSFLAELLLEKGYVVHGLIRRASLIKTDRIDHIFNDIHLHYGDMTDGMGLMALIMKISPDEIYNLAAQSHVAVSFETPEYTANADALGTLRLLEIIRNYASGIKFYQASTSELFGSAPAPQNENTPFEPRSPYAAAKLYAYWLTKNYREAYGLYAVNGILFNHESPRRGETFVTQKIVKHVAKYGVNKTLQIGNVWSVRDWSHAKDMVEGMYLMMHQDTPKDYVLGSGTGYTVKDFITRCYEDFEGVTLDWVGKFDDPVKAFDRGTGKLLVESIDRYYRPLEVDCLIADPSLARKELGWHTKISLDEMIEEMMNEEADNVIVSTS